jgi:hypothetical protein
MKATMTDEQCKGLPFHTPAFVKIVSSVYIVLGTFVCLAFYITKYAIKS